MVCSKVHACLEFYSILYISLYSRTAIVLVARGKKRLNIYVGTLFRYPNYLVYLWFLSNVVVFRNHPYDLLGLLNLIMIKSWAWFSFHLSKSLSFLTWCNNLENIRCGATWDWDTLNDLVVCFGCIRFINVSCIVMILFGSHI